jgi:pyridine nucleotide-disulfide oxidoreductase family protein
MKRLLLLGAGHAHVQVMQDLAREPIPGVQVTLVSPFLRQMYSGMVPGWMAGRYRLEECAISLAPLIRESKVRWFHNKLVALDVEARRARLADGERLGFDVLSVDTGSVMDSSKVRGAAEHAMVVRPIEDFAQRWMHVLARAERGARLTIVVVGAGGAGVELSLAIAQRLRERCRVVLVTGDQVPLPYHPMVARRSAMAALKKAGVLVMRMPCLEVSAHHVHLAGPDGGRIDLPCDAAIVCTGSQAPRWLPESGLELDALGYIATSATLQSVSHPDVFAVGDVSTRVDLRHPKSGVYAVRAGPALVANLRRHLAGEPLLKHRPPRNTLNLLSCGDGTAIATWGPLAAHGAWAWRWKDRIDRAFVNRYNRDPVPVDEANTNVMAGAIDPAADVARVAVSSPILLPNSAPAPSLAALEATVVLKPGEGGRQRPASAGSGTASNAARQRPDRPTRSAAGAPPTGTTPPTLVAVASDREAAAAAAASAAHRKAARATDEASAPAMPPASPVSPVSPVAPAEPVRVIQAVPTAANDDVGLSLRADLSARGLSAVSERA